MPSPTRAIATITAIIVTVFPTTFLFAGSIVLLGVVVVVDRIVVGDDCVTPCVFMGFALNRFIAVFGDTFCIVFSLFFRLGLTLLRGTLAGLCCDKGLVNCVDCEDALTAVSLLLK